jgi:hypothetical protein
MGKKGRAEVGTPKWVANKSKSKGLQKLRWFCQMCQKQCRDQNGFKCHTTSESHQRQLLMFGENPGQFLYNFSKVGWANIRPGFFENVFERFCFSNVLKNGSEKFEQKKTRLKSLFSQKPRDPSLLQCQDSGKQHY